MYVCAHVRARLVINTEHIVLEWNARIALKMLSQSGVSFFP